MSCQMEEMDENFSMAPLWSIPSPGIDCVLPNYVGYDHTNGAESTFWCVDVNDKISPSQVLGKNQEYRSEWPLLTNSADEEGKVVSYSGVGNDNFKNTDYSSNDVFWLYEFMDVYGINDLSSDDKFNVNNIDVPNFAPHLKESYSACRQTLVVEINKNEASNTMLQSCTSNISSGRYQKTNTVSSHDGKCCSVCERKRELNRCAAVKYRGKRREKARQRKEELHELELLNVKLKTELSWLQKEEACFDRLYWPGIEVEAQHQGLGLGFFSMEGRLLSQGIRLLREIIGPMAERYFRISIFLSFM
ncbi:unnamed protein product [Thelazia callipaeda]|uniref:BZIP domain-containing protein n=1 Tax=Thelazia callipaeda TaxID=103827 RepID=A0A0N5D8Y5_THECL|nr:unnamed protein product [Thelazia callipaeda]